MIIVGGDLLPDALRFELGFMRLEERRTDDG